MKVMNCFDAAFVVNLDRDTARLQRISERLARLNTDFTRQSALAVEGTIYENNCYDRVFAGAAMTHLSIVKRAWTEGLESVLIFEDDAIIADDIAARMPAITEQLSRLEWGVFYLGLRIDEDGRQLDESLWQVSRCHHAHAYAVHRRAMPQCIQWLEEQIVEGDFDAFYFDTLRVYARPLLAVQEPGHSYTADGYLDRLVEYALSFDMHDFVRRCKELQHWQPPGPKWWWPDARTPNERAASMGLIHMRYSYHRINHDVRSMTFQPDGKIGDGAGTCELFWDLRFFEGAMWMDMYSATEKTCSLKRYPDEVWRGRWDHYEQMEIELIPTYAR